MSLILNKNKRYKQGYFYPTNKKKYIGKDVPAYRSGLELAYFTFLDTNKKCVKWNSEGVTIPYFWDIDQKWHKYYIDLAVTFDDGITYLIEIKPYRQTLVPEATARKRKKTLLNEQVTFSKNTAKWEAAKKFAKKNGYKFMILTEKEIGYKTKK